MTTTFAGTLFASPNTTVAQNPSTEALIKPSVVRLCQQGTATPVTLYTDRNRGGVAANDPMATGGAVGTAGVNVAGNIYGWAEPGHYTLIIDTVSYPLTVYPDPDEPAPASAAPSTLLPVTADTVCNNSTTGVTIPGLAVPLVAGAGVVFGVGKLTVQSTSAANFTLNATAPDATGYLNFWAYAPADTVTNPGGAVHAIPGAGNWYNALMSGGGTSVLSGYFGGFTSTGSRQTIQFGFEASSPTAGNLSFAFHQETAAAFATTVYAASSYLTVFRS